MDNKYFSLKKINKNKNKNKNIPIKGCSKYTFKFKIQTLIDLFFEKIRTLNSIFYVTSYVLVLYNLDSLIFVSPNVFWPTTGSSVSSTVTA